MAVRLTPNSFAVRVVQEAGSGNDAAAELATEQQGAQAVYEAWERQAAANDAAVAEAARRAGAGNDPMAIVRGWPYR